MYQLNSDFNNIYYVFVCSTSTCSRVHEEHVNNFDAAAEDVDSDHLISSNNLYR